MRGKTADEVRAGMKGVPEDKLNHILPHKVRVILTEIWQSQDETVLFAV